MTFWNSKTARRALMLAMVPVLFSTVGCKKKPAPTPPPPPPPVVEVSLQVASVSPSTVNVGEATSATIMGSAFKEGATVQIVGPAGNLAGDRVVVSGSNSISVMVPALATAGSYNVIVTNPTGESATLRNGITARQADLPCKFTMTYFDLASSSIRSDARKTLDGSMSCIQGAAGAIRIEGHADERGTTDYNLALGQRRADSVKGYLTRQGVAAARISTISFGEERPSDSGTGEGAWQKNRRAETTASP